MRGKYLQTTITTGRFTLPVTILITITCWVMVYFLVPDIPVAKTAYNFWEGLITFSIPVWVNKLICLLIYFAIGYLLVQMNNAFSLIQIRVSVQTSIYFLLVIACPIIQILSPGILAALALVIAIFLLFNTYQNPRPAVYTFHAFLFIGLGSLVFPQITLLAPILLIGAFNFQGLTPKSFFAAIIGWSLPYWFLFGHAYFYDNLSLFYQPFIELATFYPIRIDQLQSWEIVTLGYCFILFLISSIHSFVESYKDKIRTRAHLRFFILLNICIFLLIVLQPVHCDNLLPTLFMGVSILASHMFVLTNSKSSNVFFICAVLGLILLFCFNVWVLL